MAFFLSRIKVSVEGKLVDTLIIVWIIKFYSFLVLFPSNYSIALNYSLLSTSVLTLNTSV